MQPWDIKQLWLREKPQVKEATGEDTDSGVPRGLVGRGKCSGKSAQDVIPTTATAATAAECPHPV